MKYPNMIKKEFCLHVSNCIPKYITHLYTSITLRETCKK